MLTQNAELGTGGLIRSTPCLDGPIPDDPLSRLHEQRRPNGSPLGGEELPDPLLRGGPVAPQAPEDGLREGVPDGGLELVHCGHDLIGGERGGPSLVDREARAAVGAREERPHGDVEVGRGDREVGRDGDVGGGDWGGGGGERGQELERVEGGFGDRVGGEVVEEDRAAEARGRVGGEGERDEELGDHGGGDRGVGQDVLQDEARAERRHPRHFGGASCGDTPRRGFEQSGRRLCEVLAFWEQLEYVQPCSGGL